MKKITAVILVCTTLFGCSKNSYESCVEYWEDHAKKEGDKNVYIYVASYCKVGN